MPNRIIREGILTSERVNSLSERAEIFYRRLMSIVDDFGRFPATPMLLRASCYPLQLDKIKDSAIEASLLEAVSVGLVIVYEVGGKRFLEIQDFRQRSRASASKWPSSDGQVTVMRPPSAHGDGDGDGDGDGKEATPLGAGAPPFGVHQPIVDAYHELLPKCQPIATPAPQRLKRLANAVKLAKRVCASNGWTYEPETFWRGYFAVCANDPWLRGDVANPNNARWKQNLDVLLADERLAQVIDQAINSMREAA